MKKMYRCLLSNHLFMLGLIGSSIFGIHLLLDLFFGKLEEGIYLIIYLISTLIFVSLSLVEIKKCNKKIF